MNHLPSSYVESTEPKRRRRRRRRNPLLSALLRRPTRRFAISSGIAFGYLVALACVEYWPGFAWPLATLVTLAPAWLLLLPYAGISLIGLARQPVKGALVVLAGVPLLLNFLGFESRVEPPGDFRVVGSLRVASANIGNSNLSPDSLRSFFERRDLDILVLQEVNASSEYKQELVAGYHGRCHGHLCVMSRWPVEPHKQVSRRNFDDWGVYLATFRVEHPAGEFLLADVHLRTPRRGIESVLSNATSGLGALGAAVKLQAAESATVRSVIDGSELPTIIAGDFNMTSQHPLFRRDWQSLLDAHRQAGHGLGYTKFTRWHGVRIDHMLVSANDWRIRDNFVVSGFGGDHEPLISELVRIKNGY